MRFQNKEITIGRNNGVVVWRDSAVVHYMYCVVVLIVLPLN